jgi:hypothetical protein
MYIEELRRTNFGCPSEWEGRLADGLAVFVRYRSGELSIGYGPTRDEAITNAFVIWRSRDPIAGCMATGSMLKLTGLRF